jgi:hypothetical protein
VDAVRVLLVDDSGPVREGGTAVRQERATSPTARAAQTAWPPISWMCQ